MPLLRSLGFRIAGILFLAACWKGLLLLWGVIPFNADEAVVGLMARHILQGERPIFFYGQAYMGSLDAFLAAGCFRLFGAQVGCIRLVQVLLYLGVVASTVWIGKEAFGSFRAGLLAGLLLAFPTVNVTLYTTASLGGYGEALLIGNLALGIALHTVRVNWMDEGVRPPVGWFTAWGFLVGLGLWANGLSLVFAAPAGFYLLVFLLIKKKPWISRFLFFGGTGFLIGAFPWWLFALANGPSQLLLELFGNAVAVEKTAWLLRTFNHLINFLLVGTSALFGIRPPWEVRWLAWPILPFVLIFWFFVIRFWAGRVRHPNPERGAYALLAGVCLVLLAGYIFTPFGIDPSGRYFVPFTVPMALVAAQMILTVPRRRWQGFLLTALLIGYHIWGTLECAVRFPPGLTTQFYEPTIIDHRADEALIKFLKDEGETRGYTNYWVAYPIAFLSQEEIILVPRLPYHLDMRYTPRDDRYAPYQKVVEQSDRAVYITTRNPLLDDYLRANFQDLGVSWQEKKIGDYLVYYRLSRVVRPAEIGLGELRE